jgi:hypothetical protein
MNVGERFGLSVKFSAETDGNSFDVSSVLHYLGQGRTL